MVPDRGTLSTGEHRWLVANRGYADSRAAGCQTKEEATNGHGSGMGATSAGQIVVATTRVAGGVFTNLALDVQQSSDDGSTDPYADVNGLSFTFSEPEVSRKTISAATEAWKRLRVRAFTRTDAQLLVTIGVLQGA